MRQASFRSNADDTVSVKLSELKSMTSSDEHESRGGARRLLDLGGSFEDGVFGALFTITKERGTSSKRMTILGIIVDFAQLLVFIMRPSFGWSPVVASFWTFTAVFDFDNPLIGIQTYTVYVAFFALLCLALLFSLATCVFVGYNFKNNSFPFLWPIKFVRFVFGVFLSTFFISFINFLVIAIDCDIPPGASKPALQLFPDVPCWDFPHLIVAVSSIFFAIVAIVLGFLVALVQFDPDPNSKAILSGPQSRVEVHSFIIKTAIAVVIDLLSNPQYRYHTAALLAVSTWIFFYDVWRYLPSYSHAMNKLRGGLFAVLFFASAVLAVLTLVGPSVAGGATIAVVAGAVPAFFAGYLLVSIRVRRLNGDSWVKRDAQGDLIVNSTFRSPEEVELLTRFVRDDARNDEAVVKGEAMLSCGLGEYPDSAFLHIVMANYQMCVQENHSLAQYYFDKAAQLSPGLAERFCIFVRERERKHRSQSEMVARGGRGS